MVIAARTMVEKEPNYSYVTARILLNNIENEVLGFLGIDLAKKLDRKEMYNEALVKTFEKGIELDFLNKELLSFDLEKLQDAIDEKEISTLHTSACKHFTIDTL